MSSLEDVLSRDWDDRHPGIEHDKENNALRLPMPSEADVVNLIGTWLDAADAQLEAWEEDSLASNNNDSILGSALYRGSQDLAHAVGQLASELEQQAEDLQQDTEKHAELQAMALDMHAHCLALHQEVASSGLLENEGAERSARNDSQAIMLPPPPDEDFVRQVIKSTAVFLRDVEATLLTLERYEAEDIADAALTVARLVVDNLWQASYQAQHHVVARRSGGGVTIEELPEDDHENTQYTSRQISSSSPKTSPHAPPRRRRRRPPRHKERLRVLWPPLAPALGQAVQWGQAAAVENPVVATAIGLLCWPTALAAVIVAPPLLAADHILQGAYQHLQQHGPFVPALERGAATAYHTARCTALTGRLVARQTARLIHRNVVERHGGDWTHVAQELAGAAVDRITHPVETLGTIWQAVCWTKDRVMDVVAQLQDDEAPAAVALASSSPQNIAMLTDRIAALNEHRDDNNRHPNATRPTSENQSMASLPDTNNESVDDLPPETNADDPNDGPNESEAVAVSNRAPPLPLYKSTRFKGYLTILLASIIYYDAAQKSKNAYAAATVAATEQQQVFSIAVASISMGLSGAAVGMHLDQISPLKPLWQRAFGPASRFELLLALTLFLWWTAVTAWQTSIQGIAGDGKGQFSLYYSAWVCVYAALFAVLEPWWVAAGWQSSVMSFVVSWPNRAPGWLCVWAVSIINLVWILDLWQNYSELQDREATLNLYYYFKAVPTGQWQFMVSLSVFTVLSSAVWVLVELFRETTPSGDLSPKSAAELYAEGLCILVLLGLWIPSIMLVTTSGGAAALVGNTYFFSWAVTILLAETAVWLVHDLRDRMHQSLADKAQEYRARQAAVQAQARDIEDEGPPVVAPEFVVNEF